MSLPEIQQQSIQSNLSGAVWAPDFINFQQAQLNSESKQVMVTIPSVGVEIAQHQTHQNPGLRSWRLASHLSLTHDSRHVFPGGNVWKPSLFPASSGNEYPIPERYSGPKFALRSGSASGKLS